MPLAVAFTGPRSVGFVEEPARPLSSDEVRIRTLLSGISAGTELSAYRGTNPYLHKRWDPALRLFQPPTDADAASISYPLVGYGYEEVGRVVEAGADAGDALAPGTLVYGTWGHRAEHVASVSYARERILAPGVDPTLGIFSHMGPIALNGVLDAAPRLGETVVLFGLGVVGQLVSQLLRLCGARVVAVDFIESRRALARRLGAAHVLDPAEGPIAEQVRALTGGRGADVCVEASGSTLALHEAIRTCAAGSTVVALGFYQGEAHALSLGEEFHHNRIRLVSSQVGAVAPDLQHRWDRLRLVHTFMSLAIEGRIHCAPLISHRLPVAEAGAAFHLLDERPADVMQAVLDFGAE